MISGDFDGTRPIIIGLVVIESLQFKERIRFLVDTGSDITVIHPADGRKGKIPYATAFLKSKAESSTGAGGKVGSWPVPAGLYFLDDDKETLHIWPMDIDIAVPTARNRRLPSLLGQDLLRHYRLISDPSKGVLRLEEPGLG